MSVKKNSPKSQPPYATDLYDLILRDQRTKNISLSLKSDTKLTDDGFKIWARLLDQGHVISVFDRSNPTGTMQHITTPEELLKFMGGLQHIQYQYVLSESSSPTLFDINVYFLLREIWESNNSL